MRTDTDRLRRKCERAIRTVAPREFLGVPLYILFAADLPRDLRLPVGVCGRTHVHFDMALRSFIKNWRGRGPCMFIDDPETPVATALHEIAHVITDDRKPWQSPASAEPEATYGPAEAVGSKCGEEPIIVSYLNLYTHDAAFVRIIAHLRRRASVKWNAGTLPGFGFVPDVRECMSSEFRYDILLASETAGMRNASFAEILAAPYPPQFLERWNADIDRVVSAIGGPNLAKDLFLK